MQNTPGTQNPPAKRGTETKRRPAVRAAIAVAVIVVASLLALLMFRACSPMTIASWSATSTLQRVVGDDGTVKASVREWSINVLPFCELSLDVAEDTSADRLAEILTEVAATAAPEAKLGGRDTNCALTTVELANRSTLFLNASVTLTTQQWAVIAEHLQRGYETIAVGTDGDPTNVGPYIRVGDVSGFVDAFHALTDGDRLEDSIGPIFWSTTWSMDGAPYHSVDIETAGTPSAELGTFLEAMVPIFDGAPKSIKVEYQNHEGEPTTQIELFATDPTLEAAITAAFTASGLTGELTFTSLT